MIISEWTWRWISPGAHRSLSNCESWIVNRRSPIVNLQSRISNLEPWISNLDSRNSIIEPGMHLESCILNLESWILKRAPRILNLESRIWTLQSQMFNFKSWISNFESWILKAAPSPQIINWMFALKLNLLLFDLKVKDGWWNKVQNCFYLSNEISIADMSEEEAMELLRRPAVRLEMCLTRGFNSAPAALNSLLPSQTPRKVWNELQASFNSRFLTGL